MTPTFSLRSISMFKNSSLNKDERVAVISRETIRNAEEHGASFAELLSFFSKNKKYILICHDGKPFESVENLKVCLTPNTSGENSGIQGSGMKLSMFLGAEKEAAELIVHSRSCKSSFSARLTCKDLNNAIIEEDLEIGPILKRFFGDTYVRFNVFVLYRFQDDGVIYTAKNVSLLLDLCPTRLNLAYFPNMILGDAPCKVNNFEQALSLSRRRVYLSPSELKSYFCVDQETFLVKGLKTPESEYGYDAEISIEVYPCIGDAVGRICCLDKGSPNFGKNASDVDVSNQTLFVNFSRDGMSTNVSTGKNIDRLFDDPFFTSINSHGFFSELGIICPKNRNFISRIKDYSYAYGNDGKIIDAIQWRPLAKLRVKIIGNSDSSNLKLHDYISVFGGINEFFYSDNPSSVRELVRLAVEKLSEENPSKLCEIRNRINKMHFPFSEDSRLPIPEEVISDSNLIHVYKKNKYGQMEKISKVIPGQVERRVELKFKDGSPVNVDLENVTRGFTFDRKGGNVFDFLVDDLSFVKDNGEIVPISESEYMHSKGYIPKKDCYADIGKERYHFGFKCEIPKSEKTSGGAQNRTRPGDGTFSTRNYYKGLPGEYGRFSKSDGLKINESNPTIRKIVCRDKDKFPWLAKAWADLYRTLAKMAREIINENRKKVDIHVLHEHKDDLEKLYEDEESYYLNTHLSMAFRYHAPVIELLDRIDKEIPEEVEKEEFVEEIDEKVSVLHEDDLFMIQEVKR